MSRTWAVVGGIFTTLVAAGCGGDVKIDRVGCDAPTLANCPQDTIPDAAECPLPPVAGAQGFFTVGCRVTADCSSGTQVCVCSSTPSGTAWGCAM
jgi:hypothetical protein